MFAGRTMRATPKQTVSHSKLKEQGNSQSRSDSAYPEHPFHCTASIVRSGSRSFSSSPLMTHTGQDHSELQSGRAEARCKDLPDIRDPQCSRLQSSRHSKVR